MKYYLEQTSEIKTKKDLMNIHYNKSFPKVWNEDVYSLLGISPIISEDMPETTIYQKAIKNDIAKNESGQWVESWSIVDLADEEKAEKNLELSVIVRRTRDTKLAETDWRLLKAIETGETLSADWADYRQALRDIPDHANFPYLTDGDWPVSP
jgi:hypothetical protein